MFIKTAKISNNLRIFGGEFRNTIVFATIELLIRKPSSSQSEARSCDVAMVSITWLSCDVMIWLCEVAMVSCDVTV